MTPSTKGISKVLQVGRRMTYHEANSYHEPQKPTLKMGWGPGSQKPWAPDLLPLTANPIHLPSPSAPPHFTLCGLLSDWLHWLPWLQNSYRSHTPHLALTTGLPEPVIPPKDQTKPPTPLGQSHCINFVSSPLHTPTPYLLFSVFAEGTQVSSIPTSKQPPIPCP